MVDFAKSGEFVRKIIDASRKGEFDYEGRPPPKIDWKAYDVAQAKEMADLIHMIGRFVDVAVQRIEKKRGKTKRGRGRPPTKAGDITKVLLLQSYLGAPNRVAEGIIVLFGEKLGISGEFSYKTIERGYDRRAVNEVLDEVFALTNLSVRGLERIFSVDGSGQTTSNKRNYAQDAQQRRYKKDSSGRVMKHGYVYNVAVIGVKYKLFSAWRSSCDDLNVELEYFPDLIRQTKVLHPDIEMVLGDTRYAGRPQCKIVHEIGAVPRFLPRRNVTMKRDGVRAWMEMLLDMAENPQKWFSEYHLRSISETGNSMVNGRKGPIRKRLPRRKSTESYLRAVEHNIRRLALLRYMKGLVPLPAEQAS